MKHRNDEIEALLSSMGHARFPVIDLSLDRIHELLARLGHPERRLPPVVHVAGTNGKGSLLAYLRAILEAAGYKVHRYISPHLVYFNERITLAGKDITDEALIPKLKQVLKICETLPVTAFEVITALAYLAFSETPADIVLLETGLGGRLDATNVLEAPLLTAITPISMDHMDYLGTTLAAIAGEKAGILKANVPCVTGPQVDIAAQVIAQKAQELHSPLYRFDQEWQAEKVGEHLCFTANGESTDYALPGLVGEHQIANAGTAIACIKWLKGFTITDAHISQGLRQVVWPARLQQLKTGALAALVPAGSELWLDGGHNEGAGRELAGWLSSQKKPVHLVCGMLNTKDTEAFLRPMAPYIKSLTGVAILQEPLSQSHTTISATAERLGIVNFLANDVKSAIEAIVKKHDNAIILVCGSLSLAGNTLWQNGTEP